jgi:CHASE2 domain-containing sensor protein
MNSQGVIGLLVLVGLAVVAALVAHRFERHYLLACVPAAVTADLVFMGVAFLQDGRMDPFIVMALGSGFVVAYAVAMLVGIPFALVRRRRGARHTHNPTG